MLRYRILQKYGMGGRVCGRYMEVETGFQIRFIGGTSERREPHAHMQKAVRLLGAAQ